MGVATSSCCFLESAEVVDEFFEVGCFVQVEVLPEGAQYDRATKTAVSQHWYLVNVDAAECHHFAVYHLLPSQFSERVEVEL